ncbi:MAG: hypothetical protein AAGB01_01495 [Cyanobacteria bacterium P01_F01_bin.42]
MSVAASLGIILLNPFKETRHISLECQANTVPASLVEQPTMSSAQHVNASQCLLAKTLPKRPYLWVY